MNEIQAAGERVIMVTHYVTISAITVLLISSSDIYCAETVNVNNISKSIKFFIQP